MKNAELVCGITCYVQFEQNSIFFSRMTFSHLQIDGVRKIEFENKDNQLKPPFPTFCTIAAENKSHQMVNK